MKRVAGPKLPLDKILLDTIQVRAETRQDVIDEYAADLRDNPDLDFPAIDVFQYAAADDVYHVADGRHRHPAYRLAGRTHIPAKIHQGGPKDLLRFSLGSNASHGLRRSPEDKRHSVSVALADPELQELSVRELAGLCRVSRGLVDKMRGEMGLRPVKQAEPSAPEPVLASRPEGLAAAGKPEPDETRPAKEPEAEQMPSQHNDAPPTGAGSVVQVDALGRAIPPHLVPAFACFHEFRSIVADLAKLKARTKALVGLPGGDCLGWNSLDADFDNLHSEIRFAAPYIVCPDCGHDDGKSCELKRYPACGKRGWVRESDWEQLTKEQREVAEGKRKVA